MQLVMASVFDIILKGTYSILTYYSLYNSGLSHYL